MSKLLRHFQPNQPVGDLFEPTSIVEQYIHVHVTTLGLILPLKVAGSLRHGEQKVLMEQTVAVESPLWICTR